MASDRKQKQSNSIPIRFFDGDESRADDDLDESRDDEDALHLDDAPADVGRTTGELRPPGEGGPAVAELVATRAELKRLQAQLSEAQEALARRQADFENYRKRIERERGEAYNRVVAEVASKLLPVLDNLSRALEAEQSVEASESKEFRHFLHGVELISKQLNEVLESFGIQPIAAVGERFDPHIHEAVVTEASDEYEPDTVIAQMQRGYRIGDRLLRPAMVKVAARTEAPGDEE
ncbi:MAG TPA: nucleotide exchange factor GrpE [Pyrinomonadaceae bacterium]|nr:nucleotide exchange factor GrpE [Pyrinomonadaceae bacterium]